MSEKAVRLWCQMFSMKVEVCLFFVAGILCTAANYPESGRLYTGYVAG